MINDCHMKRVIPVLFVLFLSVEGAFSQVGVGLTGGSNFSTLAIYKRPSYLTRAVQTSREFQFGAFFRYVSEKHAGMQMEFLYSRNGWSDISALENDTINEKHKRTIDYIQVPLMTHFIVGSKKIRIILEGGPYIAYALNSKEYVINTVTGSELSNDFVWKDGVDNRWDYGLKGSAGFQFYFPFGAFEAKAFYTFGYGNVFLDKNEAVETSQNRIFGINVGYIYFFGKDKTLKPTSAEP